MDKDGWVVQDDKCDEWTTTSSRPVVPMYHWYYGGTGFHVGERVSGGSLTPRAGVSYHSSVSRGGFGHSGSVHGSSGG